MVKKCLGIYYVDEYKSLLESIPYLHSSSAPSYLSLFLGAPSMGSIKIGVDGSFSIESSRSRIRGIFRYHLCNILLHFCKEISVDSAMLTKISAVKEGLLLVSSSRWSSYSHFCIESVCANAVAWFQDINEAPWRFRNIIRESLQVSGCHISWFITHIRRSENNTDDILARIGAYSCSFIEFV